MTITAHFTPNRLPATIDEWGRQLEPEVLDALERIGEAGESTSRRLAPGGPTGNYERGIGHTVNASDVAVTVGSKARHAHLVERGREPGKMPPPAKLASIFGISKADAYPIAKSIGRSGTEGAHVMELTARAMRNDVDRIAQDVLVQLHRRRT